VNFVVGPPWLRVTVRVEGDLVRRLEPFFETAGGERGPGPDGPTVTVASREGASGDARTVFELQGDVYRAEAGVGAGSYDLAENRGEILLSRRSGPFFETFLRQIFIWESYRRGGLVLHSVAFAEGDDVVVSCGVSESGKSTLAEMLQGYFTVYSDEMNVIGADGRVWPLPFRGSGVERVQGGGGLLRVLAFHRPGPEFTAKRLEPGDAARALWPNVFVPEGADAGVEENALVRTADMLARADAFAVTVPLEGSTTYDGFRTIIIDSHKGREL
jgi:hypothetical protein